MRGDMPDNTASKLLGVALRVGIYVLIVVTGTVLSYWVLSALGELVAAAVGGLLFDGVEPLLRAWSRHVPLAIASGALRREIEDVLGRNDLLGCFRAIVSADDVSHGKPAPDTFLLALDRLRGDSPAACVVIEDSLPGITAAKAARMHVVGVATSHPAEGLREADLVVSSLTDLDLSMLDDLVGSG